MKAEYTLIKSVSNSFDRSSAIARYRRLQEIRYATARIIYEVKKHDLPSADSRIRLVRETKQYFRDKMDRNYTTYTLERKDMLKNKFVFTFNQLNLQVLKDGLREIREQIRDRRRYAKELRGGYLGNRSPNSILHRYQDKIFREIKRPKDSSQYVGLEIECILPSNYDRNELLPFAKWINITGDGSIEHDKNETDAEIKVCLKREEIRSVIPGLMKSLQDMGARVNKSCGLHVHLDQRNNPQPELTYQKLVRSLNLLYTVVPASRRENQYCTRNTKAVWSFSGSRYKAINPNAYHRHHTIEIRLFGGTLETNKIINWTETLLAIADGEIINRCPKSFDTARRYWKLSDENLVWLKARQEMFSALNVLSPSVEMMTDDLPNEPLELEAVAA